MTRAFASSLGLITGWRVVHAVMEAAELSGLQACPKNLRRGFEGSTASAGIPLT